MWYVLNSHAHLLNVLIFEAPLIRYNLPPTIGPEHTSPIIQSTFLLMFRQLVPQCRRPSPHRQEFLHRWRLTSQRPTSPMPLNSWARAFTPISCPGHHTISTTTPLPRLQLRSLFTREVMRINRLIILSETERRFVRFRERVVQPLVENSAIRSIYRHSSQTKPTLQYATNLQ